MAYIPRGSDVASSDRIMSDIFTLLDDIHVDLQLFTLGERPPQSATEQHSSASSGSSGQADFLSSPASSAYELTNRGPLFPNIINGLRSRDNQGIILEDDDSLHSPQSTCGELEERVYKWLEQQAASPGAKKPKIGMLSIIPAPYSRIRKSPTETPNTPATTAEAEESQILGERNDGHHASRSVTTSVNECSIDDYHAALLHMMSTPAECAKLYRPTMRRRYPRGPKRDADDEGERQRIAMMAGLGA
ncbi:hypothetical protein EDB81DRAFT_890802 [Dactylonectria macrodidyma]|uniref:Uncharacterized protein n=1 Tax=Dactylonectria macrodidyma TaxID=307937 RepID=A0A9P9DQE1_9HYPO|nr:hypothetical protein EDB81DRAFT_890802 [Dactylonectria macrodidyma]